MDAHSGRIRTQCSTPGPPPATSRSRVPPSGRSIQPRSSCRASGSSTPGILHRPSHRRAATSWRVPGPAALNQTCPAVVGIASAVDHGRMWGCVTDPVIAMPCSARRCSIHRRTSACQAGSSQRARAVRVWRAASSGSTDASWSTGSIAWPVVAPGPVESSGSVKRPRPWDSCPAPGPWWSPGRARSAPPGSDWSASSASRSTQKTYSQARSRLGRDSSLLMLRPCSANTRRTDSRVPGSLRTASTRVVRRVAWRALEAHRTAGAGPGEDREPGPVPGQVADFVGQDLETEQARRAGRSTAAAPRSPRSAICLPAPAVLYVVRSCQPCDRRKASAWPRAWMCE